MKKLWVDDVRYPPDDSWTVAKSYYEAIPLIEANDFDIISLDHDLGDWLVHRDEKTGYDILKRICHMHVVDARKFGEIRVHTSNPVAKEKMLGMIERYLKE